MRDGTYFIDLIAKYEQRAEVLRGLDPKLIKRATAAQDALNEFFGDIYEIDFDFRLSTGFSKSYISSISSSIYKTFRE